MKTSTKRTSTNYPGVFFKDIISDSNKVTDKVYSITEILTLTHNNINIT
ncbi:MAG: hypothetical protein U9Q20_06750 [Campylobacterota bacterium]|nr:hypothetical protein [Campylobacterota bacterium]